MASALCYPSPLLQAGCHVEKKTYGFDDWEDVGAGLAIQLLLGTIGLHQQQIGAVRTKVHCERCGTNEDGEARSSKDIGGMDNGSRLRLMLFGGLCEGQSRFFFFSPRV